MSPADDRVQIWLLHTPLVKITICDTENLYKHISTAQFNSHKLWNFFRVYLLQHWAMDESLSHREDRATDF